MNSLEFILQAREAAVSKIQKLKKIKGPELK
jgi:hypothetical protein